MYLNERFLLPFICLFLFIVGVSCSTTRKPIFTTAPNFDSSTYLSPDDYGYDIEMNSKSILSALNDNPFKPISLEGSLKKLNESKKYPSSAIRNLIMGEVLLEVYVDTVKRIREIKVIKTPSGLLTESAIKAILKAEFKSATKNGNPVNSFIRIPLEYELYEIKVRREINY